MKFSARSAKIFAALAAVLPLAAAFSQQPVTSGELGGQLHRFMLRAQSYGWSGQVLIERDGEILLHQAYGFADRKTRRPMTLSTPIGIASMSKPLTAAVILSLVGDGMLTLHDPIGEVLPQLRGKELGQRTVHQLLTHTSGLRGGDIAGTDFEADSKANLIERIRGNPVSPQGERWRYANAGYNLLAAIAEEVTGMRWEALINRRIFSRIGMERSGLWSALPPGEPPAAAYRAWADQGSPASWPPNWRVFGAGDVVSTTGDLYRFEKALRNGWILPQKTVSLMRSPHASLGPGSDSYGYGWFVAAPDGGAARYEHGGDWLGGYNGLYNGDPANNLTILILSNSRDASGMWMRQAVQKSLIDIALGQQAELPPAADGLAANSRLGGHFISDEGAEFELFDDGAITWLAAANQHAVNFSRGLSDVERSNVEMARRRTERLYAGLLVNGVSAFEEPLGKEGAPFIGEYQAEWNTLVDKYGPLVSYDVIGVSPSRRAAEYHAVLEMTNGTIATTGLWAANGTGRLSGIAVHDRDATPWPFPLAIPVGQQASGKLIAWDLFRNYGIAIEIVNDSVLRLRRLSDSHTISVNRLSMAPRVVRQPD